MSAPDEQTEALACEVLIGSERTTKCGSEGVAMVREPHTVLDLWPICRQHVDPDYDLVSLAEFVRTREAEALRAAADEQDRLSTGPLALGNRGVRFKRLIFANWLRKRADRIEQGGHQ